MGMLFKLLRQGIVSNHLAEKYSSFQAAAALGLTFHLPQEVRNSRGQKRYIAALERDGSVFYQGAGVTKTQAMQRLLDYLEYCAQNALVGSN